MNVHSIFMLVAKLNSKNWYQPRYLSIGECLKKLWYIFIMESVQFSHSVVLTIFEPMDCSMPGFPAHHQLLELAKIHVHRSRWYHPIISSSVIPFSSCLQSFLGTESFPSSQFFPSDDQITGVSDSPSVLPMNIMEYCSTMKRNRLYMHNLGESTGN